MVLAIVGLGFLSAICLVLGIYQGLTAKQNQIINRMEKVTRTSLQHTEDEETEAGPRFSSKRFLAFFGKIFATRGFTRKVEQELLKADYPVRGEEFVVFNIITIITGGLVGFAIGGVGAAIVLAFLGAVFPLLVIKRKKKQRFETLGNQIGDCLTVMSNSLKAGYSFQQAMDLVAKEMSGPLAMEFQKTLREISLGIPTEQALQNLTNRVESDDLELMITAVLIQRQVGGNLAEVLDNISHTLRERVRIKGEIKTLTAQGRISGLIIGLLPPILFAILLVINPSYIGVLFKHQLGLMILIGGVVSEFIGMLLIKKIVDIQI